MLAAARSKAKEAAVSDPESPPPPPPSEAPAPPEKGVADILKEAYEMYRLHARALLVTCAVLFVPASIVNSCARSVILGPTLTAGAAVEQSVRSAVPELEESTRALQDAYQRNADKATIARLEAEHQRRTAEIARRTMQAAGAAVGGFTLFLLTALGTLVTSFFLYGVIVPLTNGALTVLVGDRVLGGNAGWREAWMLLLRRLGPLLTAVIPAALLVALGCVFLLIPGLVLALLFAFVSPVVLIEGLSGRAALRRSVELVRADWLRVALVIIVFGVIRWLAMMVASFLIPSTALFVGSLLGDLITMVLLPVPVLGIVLLYFDIRRRREGFTNDRLRADLNALRGASS